MAVGKNKKLTKSSKKGGKGKKIIDPFKAKNKYDVYAPSYFSHPKIGATIATKTTGNKLASENLKGRVFPVCLADLKDEEEQAHRIFKFRAEDVQERRVLTNFYGMQLTTDKLRSLVRKWQTLIEANVDVKTTDGYTVRVFVIAFTEKCENAVKKTHYAQSAQVRQIRRKIINVIKENVVVGDLKQLVDKLVNNNIETQIGKVTQSVYPLNNIFVRKVKMLKTPKFERVKLMEVHGDTAKHAAANAAAPMASAAEEDEGNEVPEPVVGDTPLEE